MSNSADSGVHAIEFYSGIGGLHLALSRSCVFGRVVCAFDWDQAACQVYAVNHGADLVRRRDIGLLSATELLERPATLWLMSPSCQPYTVLNPLAKGAADPRAKSFIHILEEVLPELDVLHKAPTHLLIENVAGFETSSTRTRTINILRGLGYEIAEFLLTPLQFGIPNSRLRYYLLAKKAPLCFLDVAEDVVMRHIPGMGGDWVDPRSNDDFDIDSVSQLKEYLDTDELAEEHRIPDRALEKWGHLFDIVLPSARRTCCFTRGYTRLVERAGSVLQANEKLEASAVFGQFLAAQKAGKPDAVRILDSLKLRYFSPSELLRLFSFSEVSAPLAAAKPRFVWPDGISNKTRYKLIGNSVNVTVVLRLIEYLYQYPSYQDQH